LLGLPGFRAGQLLRPDRLTLAAHKTVEGTRLQAQAGTGVRAFIASTLPEIYQILQSGLVEEGLVDDASFNSFSCIFFAQLAACRVLIVQVLYSMPIGSDKLDELASLQSRYPQVALRLMVDHAKQVEFLQRYGIQKDVRWSVFVKVDGGGK
jgi:D-serine deaminase-like pyridoxal phosphate-dependent protein